MQNKKPNVYVRGLYRLMVLSDSDLCDAYHRDKVATITGNSGVRTAQSNPIAYAQNGFNFLCCCHPFDPALKNPFLIGIGTPLHNKDLIIQLGGENMWHDCSKQYNSSSKRKVDCESKKCPKGATCSATGCIGPYKPGCAIDDCDITINNPLSEFSSSGTMVEDVIFVSNTQVPGFLGGCIEFYDSERALHGLPKNCKGMIGLSSSKLALPTQLVYANKLPPMFSLCFPSSNENGFIGIGDHPQGESKFLQTTQLVVNPIATFHMSIVGAPSSEYFMDVKSVKIDGHVVNLNPSLLSIDKNGNGGTKISTLTPFAELHTSLYKPFVQEFINKAAGRRLKRVASVAPFEACFDSNTIGNSVAGLAVPTIDLVLPGGVKWTIYGGNSMVMTRKNVACLAFLDGGTKLGMSSAKASIVIGRHQLEDNLLVFDLASSKLSFSYHSQFEHPSNCIAIVEFNQEKVLKPHIHRSEQEMVEEMVVEASYAQTVEETAIRLRSIHRHLKKSAVFMKNPPPTAHLCSVWIRKKIEWERNNSYHVARREAHSLLAGNSKFFETFAAPFTRRGLLTQVSVIRRWFHPCIPEYDSLK
ncbi:hypothetical protein VNO77_03992 [Canavalia gladiata]|uniref:Peptidase A1 domain-containing protein n=1 Tax=Canavalia gladiata TaxID=3824 RepID=A0AAN9MXT9_CANGL